jgi:hypothetical protein
VADVSVNILDTDRLEVPITEESDKMTFAFNKRATTVATPTGFQSEEILAMLFNRCL